MRFRILAGFLAIGAVFALNIGGCASQQSVVVATIDGENVTLAEFDTMFVKNNGGIEAAQKASADDREKFLDLYVKFKLKVKDAYAHGYNNDPEVRNELREYERTLAVTHLIEKEINGPALQQLYDRRLLELRASHILLRLPPNASPADTLKAYTKAMKIIDSLKAGRSFEELAVNNSEDPSVKNNKGDLYYFTSGALVPEFEEAAFSVQPGAFVPYPVRTQFGYHIIKVTDRHPNPGSIQVSHIMKRLTPTSSAQDSAKAFQELNAVLDSLSHGEKFADLARAVSDDKYSSVNGGDLGFIERRRTVREFDSVAFTLKPGQVSGIVKTPFGLHLIMVTAVRTIPPFASMQQELTNFYKQYRYQKEFDGYVTALKKEYSFAELPEGVSAWKSSVDTSRSTNDAKWDSSFSEAARRTAIFSISGQRITIDSVIHRVKTNEELRGLPFSSEATTDKILDKTSQDFVLERKAESMESEYPDFQKIMEDYEKGILLFKSEQNEVWNKVVANDSSLHLYFDANRSKYTWPDRVDVQEIYMPTDSVAKIVTFLLRKQKLPFDSVAAQFNTRQSTKEKNGAWGMIPVTSNGLTQRAWTMNKGDVSEFFQYESGFSIIRVLDKDPARNKTFQEAGSELAGAFQEAESKRLENEWYESLLKKYPVKVNKEALNPPSEHVSKQNLQ